MRPAPTRSRRTSFPTTTACAPDDDTSFPGGLFFPVVARFTGVLTCAQWRHPETPCSRPASHSRWPTTVSRDLLKNKCPRAFCRGLVPFDIGIFSYAGIDLAVYDTLKYVLRKYIMKDMVSSHSELVAFSILFIYNFVVLGYYDNLDLVPLVQQWLVCFGVTFDSPL